MRSQLGRVRGLGAAKHGTHEWWGERLTSLALIPLTLWFLYAAFHFNGHARADVAHWLASPVNAALMIATVIATFLHMRLGLQVVIEDYIHGEPMRMALLLANRAAAYILGILAVVATLKLAFTG
ncbi:MAG: succinate dehydrogenase, hydrophobic membrane anchor protein [Acidisphaera sp.]|nr:succinate dehydrogenase, hydrophobic membrane anchor protein [Acidisphaera sp.]